MGSSELEGLAVIFRLVLARAGPGLEQPLTVTDVTYFNVEGRRPIEKGPYDAGIFLRGSAIAWRTVSFDNKYPEIWTSLPPKTRSSSSVRMSLFTPNRFRSMLFWIVLI
jgi:hypothetical protein